MNMQRQQLLGILAIGVIALWLGDRLIFTPLTKTWKQRSAQITHLTRSVEDGVRLLERREFLVSRWDNMRSNMLSGDISAAENQLLTTVERCSQASRMGISSIRPQWKHNTEDYSILECRVDAFGNLAALTRFLYEIENDPLGVRLDLVEITSRDDRGEQFVLGLQVSSVQLKTTATP